MDTRIAELREAHDNADKKADKDFIMSRIASLSGGIGVIYVGGNTDLEQKELYDRVDDAVCAVRSALEEGILPGGGVALKSMHTHMENLYNTEENFSKKTAYAVLGSALIHPLKQILSNAGIDFEELYDNPIKLSDFNYGYDVKNEKWGDMIKMGIIDPLKVTRSALQNAVSVAVTILSTNAIITMAREIDNE